MSILPPSIIQYADNSMAVIFCILQRILHLKTNVVIILEFHFEDNGRFGESENVFARRFFKQFTAMLLKNDIIKSFRQNFSMIWYNYTKTLLHLAQVHHIKIFWRKR